MNNNNLVIKDINNLDTSALSAEEVERLDTLKAKLEEEEAKWSPKPVGFTPDPRAESSIRERIDALFPTASPAAKWWQSKKAIVAIGVATLMLLILNSGALIGHMSIYAAEACLMVAEQSAPSLVSEVAPVGSFWAKEKSPSEKVRTHLRTARVNLCAALKAVDAPQQAK